MTPAPCSARIGARPLAAPWTRPGQSHRSRKRHGPQVRARAIGSGKTSIGSPQQVGTPWPRPSDCEPTPKAERLPKGRPAALGAPARCRLSRRQPGHSARRAQSGQGRTIPPAWRPDQGWDDLWARPSQAPERDESGPRPKPCLALAAKPWPHPGHRTLSPQSAEPRSRKTQPAPSRQSRLQPASLIFVTLARGLETFFSASGLISFSPTRKRLAFSR